MQAEETDDGRLRLDATARTQLSVLLGCGMLAQMGIGMIVPLLPSFAERIGLAAGGVGLVVAMPSVARLLLNLPLGALADVSGRKLPLVAGSIVEAFGSFGTALATSLGTLLVPRLWVGAGSAAASAAGNAYMLDVVDRYPRHRGFLLGTSQAVLTLAFAAGPACGGLLAEATSFGAALPFGLLSVVLLASAPLYQLLLPETRPAAARGAALSISSARETVGAALHTSLDSFGSLLKQRPQIALLALRFGLIAGWSAWLTVLPLHAAATWGATAGDLGQMFSIMSLVGFVSAPAGGFLADRFGRTPVIAAGSLSSALALGALALAEGKLAFYVLLAIWDVGEAMLIAASTALSADVTNAEQRGAQSSLGNQVQDLTFCVMPVLLGAVASTRSNCAACATAAARTLALIAMKLRPTMLPVLRRGRLLTTATLMLASNAAFAMLMRGATVDPKAD